VRTSRVHAAGLRVFCLALICACVGGSADPGADSAASDAAGVAPIVARAEASVASGDLDAGIEAYREAYERTPWNTRIASSLVAAYVARAEKKRTKPGGAKGLDLAEADLRAALAIAPKQPAVERSLATVLLERAALVKDDAEASLLREEAAALAPDLATSTPVQRLPVERRLDIAYDLIEREQLDAALDQLDALVRDYPQNTAAAQLQAQALVRKGGVQTRRGDYKSARQSYTRAVEVYARLTPCDGTRCTPDELELAHRNRISSALDGANYDAARAALVEAKAVGLSFPDLEQKWPELQAP
jgi:tetratricopeptide (TPR) repeat protein